MGGIQGAFGGIICDMCPPAPGNCPNEAPGGGANVGIDGARGASPGACCCCGALNEGADGAVSAVRPGAIGTDPLLNGTGPPISAEGFVTGTVAAAAEAATVLPASTAVGDLNGCGVGSTGGPSPCRDRSFNCFSQYCYVKKTQNSKNFCRYGIYFT